MLQVSFAAYLHMFYFISYLILTISLEYGYGLCCDSFLWLKFSGDIVAVNYPSVA